MKKLNLYSDKMLGIYRLIAIICFLVLLVAKLFDVIDHFTGTPLSLIEFIPACCFLLLFIFLAIQPQRFELMAIVSFFYFSITMIFDSVSENPMGLLMYFLTISFLMARGFFRKNRKLKICCFLAIFLILMLSQLRFGLKFFIGSLIGLLGYTLVYVLGFFFIYQTISRYQDNEKVLNLSDYPGLTERDKEWLELILQETKYEAIASQYNMSFGSVRNRFRKIFKILQVSDRIGFMATYGGYTIKK